MSGCEKDSVKVPVGVRHLRNIQMQFPEAAKKYEKRIAEFVQKSIDEGSSSTVAHIKAGAELSRLAVEMGADVLDTVKPALPTDKEKKMFLEPFINSMDPVTVRTLAILLETYKRLSPEGLPQDLTRRLEVYAKVSGLSLEEFETLGGPKVSETGFGKLSPAGLPMGSMWEDVFSEGQVLIEVGKNGSKSRSIQDSAVNFRKWATAVRMQKAVGKVSPVNYDEGVKGFKFPKDSEELQFSVAAKDGINLSGYCWPASGVIGDVSMPIYNKVLKRQKGAVIGSSLIKNLNPLAPWVDDPGLKILSAVVGKKVVEDPSVIVDSETPVYSSFKENSWVKGIWAGARKWVLAGSEGFSLVGGSETTKCSADKWRGLLAMFLAHGGAKVYEKFAACYKSLTIPAAAIANNDAYWMKFYQLSSIQVPGTKNGKKVFVPFANGWQIDGKCYVLHNNKWMKVSPSVRSVSDPDPAKFNLTDIRRMIYGDKCKRMRLQDGHDVFRLPEDKTRPFHVAEKLDEEVDEELVVVEEKNSREALGSIDVTFKVDGTDEDASFLAHFNKLKSGRGDKGKERKKKEKAKPEKKKVSSSSSSSSSKRAPRKEVSDSGSESEPSGDEAENEEDSGDDSSLDIADVEFGEDER